MHKIILKTEDEKDSKKIISLAYKLGVQVVKESSPRKSRKRNSARALAHLKRIAVRGKVANLIRDPLKWQKELRKEKKLVSR